MSDIVEIIDQEIEAVYPEIVNIRRDIHRNPEPGRHEYRTSKLIADILGQAEIDVTTGVLETGVLGMIRGKKPGMTIGIRAEMDAVAMKDEKTVDYASSIEGLMHASGHDGHIAALIGTGLVLSRLKEELVGNVKLIFQPDEEGTGGAESMIREGALEDPHVDIMLGAHIWNELPYGKVETASGPFFAASDRFVITVTGAIGHAARPHVACDAITVAAQIVTALQQVVSRMVDPMAPAVLTIGTINGGVRANVIADKVVMEGTVRTFDMDLREEIIKKMDKIVVEVADAFGAEGRMNYVRRYPALVNSPDVTQQIAHVAEEVLGSDNVISNGRRHMTGEDFSYFLQKVPGTYVLVGGAKTDGSPVYPNHHSKFDFDERVMKVMMKLFCHSVMYYC